MTVCSLAGDETLLLRDVLSVDRLPVSPNPSLSSDELKAWPHLQNIPFPMAQREVLLSIGLNAPEAFWVAEERRGATDQPYAVRTTLVKSRSEVHREPGILSVGQFCKYFRAINKFSN